MKRLLLTLIVLVVFVGCISNQAEACRLRAKIRAWIACAGGHQKELPEPAPAPNDGDDTGAVGAIENEVCPSEDESCRNAISIPSPSPSDQAVMRPSGPAVTPGFGSSAESNGTQSLRHHA